MKPKTVSLHGQMIIVFGARSCLFQVLRETLERFPIESAKVSVHNMIIFSCANHQCLEDKPVAKRCKALQSEPITTVCLHMVPIIAFCASFCLLQGSDFHRPYWNHEFFN